MLNYAYSKSGISVGASLNYSPSKLGFDFKKVSSCCLLFRKDDWRLRIKLISQAIILERVDEDGMAGRSVIKGFVTANSHEEFEEIISEWLDTK